VTARPSGLLRVNNVDAMSPPLIAHNPATDLHHLAGIDALVKVDRPIPSRPTAKRW
jgi:hypothetical protein